MSILETFSATLEEAFSSLEKWRENGFPVLTKKDAETRLEICRACPHLSGRRCTLCRCFTDLKVWLPTERCRKHRWPTLPPSAFTPQKPRQIPNPNHLHSGPPRP